MTESSRSRKPEAALLWDESFLWGIMAYKALAASGLAFDIIRSEDVRRGALARYKLLFVPGGWASNKMKALGEPGIEQVRGFVRDGGSYLGFCGGAGLATLDGIGLLPVKRKPTKERVPSFSGPVMLSLARHPLWQGITEPCFHAWWPSQFEAAQDAAVLARYANALPGSFSSDLNVGDTEAHGNWAELERVYQINLDPKRLVNEPAVVEGRFGAGKVVLSLVHFDTPEDKNGATVLRNLWSYLGCDPGIECSFPGGHGAQGPASGIVQHVSDTGAADGIASMEAAAAGLIDLGLRNFLWYWRNPMLLQWRRGVRGLEYCTLSMMVKELAVLTRTCGRSPEKAAVDRACERLGRFAEKAAHLLVRERSAMQNALITYERCDDQVIQTLREELFSRSKSHGGLFKEVISDIDDLLYNVLALQRR